jgi:hypothetical protein
MFVAVTALVWAGSSCSSDNGKTTGDSSGSAGSEAKKTDTASDNKNSASSAKDSKDTGDKANDQVAADKKKDDAKLDYTQDIRGHCDIKTDFADDHACIPAPLPGEGIQIHIGPSNYDDPDEVAKFVMHPGEESSDCFAIHTPNKDRIVYQTNVLSGRAGTHHMINTLFEGDEQTGSFGNCGGRNKDSGLKQIGSLPGASKPYMPRSQVAPEYAHVGNELAGNALLEADMHYFNFTEKDILREVWINLYFAPDESKITEYSKVIRGFGGLGWNSDPIMPGTDKTYKYECAIKGDGNIMQLLGHYHSHGKQFTSSIRRKNGQIDKVFEMFNYLEPATFDYNSVVKNPEFADNASGATSGILKVQDGDVLLWDCHIINDGMVALKYINEVKNGEMCNVWGYSIGTDSIQCDLK